ncbi:MAG: electron transport complex subunit RsxC [Ruminococcaceae bacterium]|nr:electron transport complex subunit RsxC [Oscillospiraceae bacterium]
MDKNLTFPKKPYRTHGGVHVPHRKNTAHAQSVIMPPPSSVTIPMSQHIGAPCKPVVKVGDVVSVGQIIGDSDAYVSAPIHSSVSGTVKKIEKIAAADGSKVDAITIESDGEMRMYEGITPPVINDLSDLLKAVRASGLVGLGGAGFPAHVKLNIPPDKEVDTLIINVAECEPYITADHREVLENSWAVMSGVYALKDILGLKRIIIGVENNKPDAIKELRTIADHEVDKYDEVRILALKASYPYGAEKVLIKACTNRTVPMGGLPSDAGCIVMNVASVAFLAEYMKTGVPLVKKRITVDGDAIKNPQNVIVPVGTSVKDIIEFCGGYKEEPKKLIMGGPMMGASVSDDSLFIAKQNNAILAFSEKEARLREESACIRCGRCVDACPMKLMPTSICQAVDAKDTKAMMNANILNCMECGCCSYACPANRHLVHNIRLGKQILNNEKKRQMTLKEGK